MLSHSINDFSNLIKSEKHKSIHVGDGSDHNTGLYISEKICNSFGGVVHVETDDRRGCMFVFTMKAEEVE